MSKQLQAVDMTTPGANLEAYLSSVSAIPVLSVEAERELAERLHYQNDLEAARQLVMSHLRLWCILQKVTLVMACLKPT